MASTDRRSDCTTVVLVDEDAMFRRGVRELLESDGFRILAEAQNADDAVTHAAETRPDVVLLAVWMRGTSGIETARRIRDAMPRARIVMLTNSADPADAKAAIRAGACGYVLKDDSPGQIADAVRAAAAGGSPLSPHIASALLAHLSSEASRNGSDLDLTAREQKVLELLAAGRRNSEIAADLAISVYTVKRHVSNLLMKLEAENRTQAAVEAARRGLV